MRFKINCKKPQKETIFVIFLIPIRENNCHAVTFALFMISPSEGRATILTKSEGKK